MLTALYIVIICNVISISLSLRSAQLSRRHLRDHERHDAQQGASPPQRNEQANKWTRLRELARPNP